MFLNKLLFLLLTVFALPIAAEERWITLPLADSYEHQILGGLGAHTMHEYWESFQKEGLEILHLEVQHEMAIFENEAALKEWITSYLAPLAEAEEDLEFTEKTLTLMKKRGWIDLGEEKIAFPRKTLLTLVK